MTRKAYPEYCIEPIKESLKDKLCAAVEEREAILLLEKDARAEITKWNAVPLGEAIRTGGVAKRIAAEERIQRYQSEITKVEAQILKLAIELVKTELKPER